MVLNLLLGVVVAQGPRVGQLLQVHLQLCTAVRRSEIRCSSCRYLLDAGRQHGVVLPQAPVFQHRRLCLLRKATHAVALLQGRLELLLQQRHAGGGVLALGRGGQPLVQLLQLGLVRGSRVARRVIIRCTWALAACFWAATAAA